MKKKKTKSKKPDTEAYLMKTIKMHQEKEAELESTINEILDGCTGRQSIGNLYDHTSKQDYEYMADFDLSQKIYSVIMDREDIPRADMSNSAHGEIYMKYGSTLWVIRVEKYRVELPGGFFYDLEGPQEQSDSK